MAYEVCLECSCRLLLGTQALVMMPSFFVSFISRPKNAQAPSWCFFVVKRHAYLLHNLFNEDRQQVCQHLAVPVECWTGINLYQVHLQNITRQTVNAGRHNAPRTMHNAW